MNVRQRWDEVVNVTGEQSKRTGGQLSASEIYVRFAQFGRHDLQWKPSAQSQMREAGEPPCLGDAQACGVSSRSLLEFRPGSDR